ncbi:hypothetical protein [Desertivibrio insolitus]|uniref:hypothetical protein n=1 Tax=Herbiconiux sp. SYSU D00978 TaxID=2812562 RepID=UPI001A9721A8|nr:hypothetical protein [Herbiconiux sp. SYSU D00978]
MDDLSRFLPISGRARVDESAVHRDIAPELRRVLMALLSAHVDPAVLDALAERLAPGEGDARGRLVRIIDSTKHRRPAELGEVVLAAIDAGLPVDADITGFVVLHRTAQAPAAIRRALSNRTLVASDAGWRIGRGAEVVAPAADLVRLVYGRPLP